MRAWLAWLRTALARAGTVVLARAWTMAAALARMPVRQAGLAGMALLLSGIGLAPSARLPGLSDDPGSRAARLWWFAPVILGRAAWAQPADCPRAPGDRGGAGIPLAIDLGGRPGVPPGMDGKAYVEVPIGPSGLDCGPRGPPPRDVLQGPGGDVLRGPAGDVLGGPSGDVLRGGQ